MEQKGLFCLQALYQLYFDPDMKRKDEAQKWLTQAQASAQGWQWYYPRFFLLIIRGSFILQGFSIHETLRTQLLSQILHFSAGPRMVLTRLCVALASMALNLIPHVWSQPVVDMVAEGSQDPQTHCLALLELLTVIPEEFQSSRLAPARRSQLREALASEWAALCPMLRQLLQSQDSSSLVKEKVLHCLSSWSGLDVPLGESQELVQDCFSALSNPQLFDSAVETIVTVISQPDCHR
uniref:Exportin-1/Importin-beta-like domain-containing protein n=1 Tax=Oryzias melastigma TaxID=30732 RepID=A0A3B3BR58_ORYME